MKIRFLGTGTSQGIPVIACNCKVCKSMDFRDKRLRTSVHIEVDGLSIVIDTGPDFRQQMLRENISQLDAILFTHEHKDHTAGLDDIRAYNFKDDKDMPVYAQERVANKIKQAFDYIFAEHKYPGIPRVLLNIIDNQPFFIHQTKIIPIQVMHHKLPVHGFRIQDFTYITDAKTITEEEMQKIVGTKILVVNALRKEEHISHFNLAEALSFIEKIKPQKAFLIHLSHNMGLHKEVSLELPEQVYIAHDGLEIIIK
jgi:phosphoribosyl 1,2-cyclic phosphate phosphodiesterase